MLRLRVRFTVWSGPIDRQAGDGVEIEATQTYVTDETRAFRGRVLDDTRIRIDVSGQPEAEMTYALGS